MFHREGRRAASAALLLLLAVLGPALTADPPQAIAMARQQLASRNCTGAYRTLQDAMPEASTIKDDKQRGDALAALHFYSALALSECSREDEAKDHLRDFFRLRPGQSSLDASKYPRAFIALFNEVQRALATGEMFDRFYPGFDENAAAEEESLPTNLWSTSAAFQILAEEAEREEWARLRDDEQRTAFIEKFWKRRDPDPATEENELRRAVASRVAFADRAFIVPDELRGAMSDRGRVFVSLGPPTRVYRQALQRYETTIVAPRVRTPLTGTLERWVYFPPQLPIAKQQVEFRFITQLGYGEYVMQRDFWPMKALAAARQPRQ